MSKHRLVNYDVGVTFFDCTGNLNVVSESHKVGVGNWVTVIAAPKGTWLAVGDDWEEDDL